MRWKRWWFHIFWGIPLVDKETTSSCTVYCCIPTTGVLGLKMLCAMYYNNSSSTVVVVVDGGWWLICVFWRRYRRERIEGRERKGKESKRTQPHYCKYGTCCGVYWGWLYDHNIPTRSRHQTSDIRHQTSDIRQLLSLFSSTTCLVVIERFEFLIINWNLKRFSILLPCNTQETYRSNNLSSSKTIHGNKSS
jgi:hypothetical protein